jgi:hypothetical protein
MLDYRLLFVEQLGEHDLRVLADLGDAPATVEDMRRRLMGDPGSLDGYLEDHRLYELVFESPEIDPIQVFSPALTFAVLVSKTRRDLDESAYVSEWVGAGERLPVFDVGSLRDFIDERTRRFLMIELLASFTRIASGSVWVRTDRGYRRRRYSELDPVSLAEMVASLPADRRAPGYRRLGDVALFLTGVFPDHTSRHPLSEMRRARLMRSTGVESALDVGAEYVQFLETVGRRWYERAAEEAFLPTAGQQTLHDLAANFIPARRFLNYLADTYLHRFETGLMNPVG